MSSSQHIFEAVISVAIFVGVVPISSKRFSKRFNVCGVIFHAFALVWIMAGFVLVLSMLTFEKGGEGNMGLCIAFSYTTVIILFYIVCGRKITKNLQDILDMKEHFYDKISFERIVENNSNIINWFIKFRFWYGFMIVPSNMLVKILYRVNVIEMKNENNLIHAVSFDTKDNLIFWPTLITQGISVHLVIATQTFNDLYILNVIIQMILAFKYLRVKLGEIVTKNSKLFNEHELKLHISLSRVAADSKEIHPEDMTVEQWIEDHNSVLRLYQEFSQLFNPLLVAYFCNMCLGTAIDTFVVTQAKKTFFSAEEKFIITCYNVGNATLLMLICFAGTQLRIESSKVFDEAFHSPWYQCSKSTKADLSTISCVAKRPVRLTSYSSDTAELSLDTFIWMLRLTVSFYIALTQVKQMTRT